MLVGAFNRTSDNIGQSMALKGLGHDVIEFDYKRFPGSVFVEVVKRDKPDLVILSKCQSYSLEAVKRCHDLITTIYWYMDPVVSIAGGLDIMAKAGVCHMAAASRRGVYKEFLKVNPYSYHVHEGFNPVYNKPLDIPQNIEVSFIGQMRGDRTRFANDLKFDVITDAYNEKHSEAVCRSKINLNFTEGCGTSNRIYKVMASGGFMLTQRYDGIDEDFKVCHDLSEVSDLTDLVDFIDLTDLKKKVDYFLKNDIIRRKIALNGMMAVQKYSWSNWAARMLELSGCG